MIVFFNWNAFFSNWDENDPFYIPHITKKIIGLLFLIYMLARTFLLPKIKGVNLKKFNILDFLSIFFISLILDIIKMLAFIKCSLRNLFNNYLFQK